MELKYFSTLPDTLACPVLRLTHPNIRCTFVPYILEMGLCIGMHLIKVVHVTIHWKTAVEN